MKNHVATLIKFSFLLFCCSASAETYITFGSGVTTCGKYIEDRSNKNIDAKLTYIWLQGYLTRFSRDNRVDNISTDIPSMLQWIENYCKENPLRNFSYASARLTIYLQENGVVKYIRPKFEDIQDIGKIK